MESVASGERVRGIEIEDGENAVASKDREGGRGKEREGVIFAREGCAVRRTAAQNLGRAHFPPLSGSLSRPLFSLFFFYFFFALGRRRGARALLFIPADRVDFSFRASARPRPRVTMAAYPKIRRWGGTLFRDPRVFFARIPLAPQPPLSRAPSFFSSRLPVLPLSSVLFFSPFFLSRPPLRLHSAADVDLASAVSVVRAFAALLDFAPGVYFKRSPRSPTSFLLTSIPAATTRYARCYMRYLRRVMYAPVFGRVFTRPLFDDRLCLMLNETRRNYYRSVYCLTPFRRSAAL